MSIKFEGEPPFYLGVAESAAAQVLDTNVIVRVTGVKFRGGSLGSVCCSAKRSNHLKLSSVTCGRCGSPLISTARRAPFEKFFTCGDVGNRPKARLV